MLSNKTINSVGVWFVVQRMELDKVHMGCSACKEGMAATGVETEVVVLEA